ncbi:MAG: T9SS type A sorting domain-containing protein [Chitinophagales bacterium]|nr:T9SS type A sorting domain-containing protein [Chitinophagales bacterium]
MGLHAQVAVLAVSFNRQYCYDEAGNRICRYPAKVSKTPTSSTNEYQATTKSDTAAQNEPEQFCLYEEDVKIYPVPNDGQFYIELATLIEGLSASIYDFEGKLLYTKSINNLKTEINNVFTKPGNYMLVLACENVKLDWTIQVAAAD